MISKKFLSVQKKTAYYVAQTNYLDFSIITLMI